MNLEQIKLLKDSYMQEAKKPDGKPGTLGEYMRFCLDGGVEFVTSKDFVVFDDTNELLHCVCINDNMQSQANFPIKIMSSEYAMVQQAETIISKENFEKLLESGFLSTMVSQEKKDFMLKWADTINNQAIQPMDPEPAYKDDLKIIPRYATVPEREDYVVSSLYASVNGKKVFYPTIADALNNIEDGAVLYITQNLVLTDSINIAEGKNVTIDLCGNNVAISEAKPIFSIKDGTINVISSGSITGSLESKGDVFSIDATAGTSPIVNIGEGVMIKSNECCVYAKGTATINCAADLIATGSYAAIQGNGNASSAGTIINITGGSIKSDDIAVYFPQAGELNISNAIITGGTGVYVKSGKVSITDSEIAGDGEAGPYEFNGNGANSTGDAIVFDFCDYPGANPTAEITNTKLTSINSLALGVYDKEGTIHPEVATEAIVLNENVFVSDVACAKYCAEGVKLVYHSTVFGEDYFNTTEATPGYYVDAGEGVAAAVNTLEEAFNIVPDGGVITIKADEVVANTVPFDKGIEVNIDLNGNTLYSNEATVFNITNGTVNLVGSGVIKSNGICFRVNGKAMPSKLVVGSDILLESATSAPIFPTGNATVEVNGEVVSKAGYGAIQGNGSIGNEGTKVIINDGAVLRSEDIAIYQPQAGELEINGGSIIGSSAVYIKAGSIKISGDAILRAIGPAVDYKFNNNGANSTGDALIADFCDYPGGEPSIIIEGGTFMSDNADAFTCYSKDGVKNPEEVADNVNVSGGTFSSAIPEAYCAEGFSCGQNGSEYVVAEKA